MYKSGTIGTIRKIRRKPETLQINIDEDLTESKSSSTTSGEYIDPTMLYDPDDLKLRSQYEKKRQNKKSEKSYWEKRKSQDIIRSSEFADQVRRIQDEIKEIEKSKFEDSIMTTRRRQERRRAQSVSKSDRPKKHFSITPRTIIHRPKKSKSMRHVFWRSSNKPSGE